MVQYRLLANYAGWRSASCMHAARDGMDLEVEPASPAFRPGAVTHTQPHNYCTPPSCFSSLMVFRMGIPVPPGTTADCPKSQFLVPLAACATQDTRSNKAEQQSSQCHLELPPQQRGAGWTATVRFSSRNRVSSALSQMAILETSMATSTMLLCLIQGSR